MPSPTLPPDNPFDRTASGYDGARRRLIPSFDAFYGTALEALDGLPAHASILDLGAGSGLFSAMLHERHPQAALTLLDNASDMLALAARRFEGENTVTLLTTRMQDAAFEAGAFDAVASSLAIHHLEDDEKRALFSKIEKWLRPGGIFVNAEQIAASSPEETEALRLTWEQEVRGLGATEENLAAARERMQADRCAPLEKQVTWLEDCGFATVTTPFHAGMFAVFVAKK